MKKKKVILLVGISLTVLVVIFIIIHSLGKEKSETTIVEIAKREGFDLNTINTIIDKLDNPSFVSQLAEEAWRRLSWRERKDYFLGFLDEESAKRGISILNLLEENQQRLIIEETARLIRRYHNEIPEEEWEELKRTLSNEKGRNMIKNIKRYYLIELTPQERKKLHPIIYEIMSILEEVKK